MLQRLAIYWIDVPLLDRRCSTSRAATTTTPSSHQGAKWAEGISLWKLTWIPNSSPQACVGSQGVRTRMHCCAWLCWAHRSPKRCLKITSRLKDHFFHDLHCCNIAATNEATKVAGKLGPDNGVGVQGRPSNVGTSSVPRTYHTKIIAAGLRGAELEAVSG